MTYQPGQPAAGTAPATTRGSIQQNFQLINTYIGQDHVALDDSSDQALHKRVTLVSPIADPTVAGAVSAVYAKTVGSKSQLFFINADGAKQVTSEQVNRPTWPFHAFGGASVTAGIPTITPNSFNVASVVRHPASGDIQGWQVTFSNAAPDTNYFVLCSALATSPLNTAEGFELLYEIVSTTQFRLSYRDQSGGRRPLRLSGFSFAVLVN